MTIVPSRVSVDSTTVAVDLVENTRGQEKIDASDDYGSIMVTLKNVSGTGTVLLGSEGQPDESEWFPWAVPDGPYTFMLEPGEKMQGLLASEGAQEIAVMRGGR